MKSVCVHVVSGCARVRDVVICVCVCLCSVVLCCDMCV
jgi:hypothetical protein